MAADIPHEYKIALVGCASVGKTAYALRLRTGRFEQAYRPTLGMEMHPVKLRLRDQATGQTHRCTFNLWDCAGPVEGYWPDSSGVLAMYALDQPASRDLVFDKFLPKVHQTAGNVPTVLVANKSDLHGHWDALVHAEDSGDVIISNSNAFGLYHPLIRLAEKLLGVEELHMLGYAR